MARLAGRAGTATAAAAEAVAAAGEVTMAAEEVAAVVVTEVVAVVAVGLAGLEAGVVAEAVTLWSTRAPSPGGGCCPNFPQESRDPTNVQVVCRADEHLLWSRRLMPKISISRNHSLSPAVLKQRLVDLGEKLQTKYQAKTSWEGEKTMNVKGPGVEGKLSITDTKVDVNLDIGFLLSPMKGKIEEALTKELDRVTKPETA